MPRSLVRAIAAHVPERVVTNHELETVMNTSDAWIQERSGIRERRWVPAGGGTGASDLAAIASRQALERAGWSAADLDAIVYATLSPDCLFPGDACFLQDKLGAHGCAVLDVRNQCSGFLHALSVADAWIRSGQYQRILVVGAEVQSTGLDRTPRGRDVSVLFGDGAGALLLEAGDEQGRGILSTHLHADGRYARTLWCEGPGSLSDPRVADDLLAAGRYFPKMEGKKVFKHAVIRMPEVLQEALQAHGLRPEDLRMLIPHQANLRIIEAVRDALGLAEHQVHHNIERYGNTTAASIPICLEEAARVHQLKHGDLIGLVAFGAGFTWASCLLRW